jgi:hypothetical protein
MTMTLRNIERAKEELAELHRELLRLEKRVNSVRESVGKVITELFGTDRQAFPAFQEAALAARIAETVVSRLPGLSQVSTDRKQYVREREAADYMGVKVATLRAWRMLRSPSGPPFTRVGRMVMYQMAALEDHMKAGMVSRRG